LSANKPRLQSTGNRSCGMGAQKTTTQFLIQEMQ